MVLYFNVNYSDWHDTAAIFPIPDTDQENKQIEGVISFL